MVKIREAYLVKVKYKRDRATRYVFAVEAEDSTIFGQSESASLRRAWNASSMALYE
jgi:hypothetical protein